MRPTNIINASKKILLTCGMALLSLSSISPVSAAETIKFSVPILGDFDVSVDSLATFAKDSVITPDLAFYTKYLTPDELTKFRTLLGKTFPLSSIEAFKFFNTDFGKEMVKQLSFAINSPPEQSQLFLQGAIISAATNPNGFTIIDVLKKYESPTPG